MRLKIEIIVVLQFFAIEALGTAILNNAKAVMELRSTNYNGGLTHWNSNRVDRKKPIKMLLHGYKGTTNNEAYENITLKYLELNYQVILVDYPTIPSFIDAYKALPALANYLAAFMRWLHLINLVPLQNIHIIGYSLGGQIAGMAGNRLRALGAIRTPIGRITALDPLRIGFESSLIDAKDCLGQDSAAFVDVVHTAPGVGAVGDLGHVDYFPNGNGNAQPGCVNGAIPKEVLPEIRATDGWDRPITFDDLCSHKMARMLFTEAILRDDVKATQCPSWQEFNDGKCASNPKIVFGEKTDATARGRYYFATQAEWPYFVK